MNRSDGDGQCTAGVSGTKCIGAQVQKVARR